MRLNLVIGAIIVGIAIFIVANVMLSFAPKTKQVAPLAVGTGDNQLKL